MKKRPSSKATMPTMAMQPGVEHVSLSAFSRAEAPTEVWIRQPPSEPRSRWHRWLWIWGGGLAMIGLAILVALAGGALLLGQSEIIFPGVHVFDLDLGLQSTAEAQAILSNYWDEQAIVLLNDNESLTVRPEKLGISFDAEATAQLAHQQGRSARSLRRILQGKGRLFLPPVWEFNALVAEANLRTLAPQLLVTPVDAAILVRDGRVLITPAQTGSSLDVGATVAGLAQNPAQAFVNRQLPLAMVPVEPAIKDVQAVADRVGQLLATVISIQAYDPVFDESVTWTLSPEIWSQWLMLEKVDVETEQFDWTLNPEAAKSYLMSQVQTLGPDRRLDWPTVIPAIAQIITDQRTSLQVRIYHSTSQHTVKPGETFASIGRTHGIPYPWIQQANPGVNDALGVGQVLTIPSPDQLLPLPVVENKRIIVSISQQRMWAYENGGLKWEWPASTGIDSSPTSPGIFQIQSHETNAFAANWDLWMPYFMGIYRPVPTASFMNGFHGFPTRDGANILWTSSLGHQVTYGCILISTENAIRLYDWAEEGVIVEVRP